MPDSLLAVLIAAAAFLATSFDSLLVLVAWFATERGPRSHALGGYLLGVAAWLGIAVVVAEVAETIPPEHIGWLGLLPIGLGILGLVNLLRSQGESEASSPPRDGILATVLLTLSLSGDNLAVFVPLLAEMPEHFEWIAAATVLASALGLGLFAERLARTQVLRSALERWGPRLLPFALIALGLYILSDSPTDTLFSMI